MSKDSSNARKVVRIIHTADFHLGVTFRHIIGSQVTEKRREDFNKNIKYIVDTAIKRKVDLFLISGDVFHRSDPSPRDFVEFAKYVGKLAEAGIHVVVIAGNHDKPKIAGAQNPLQGLIEARAPFFHYIQTLPKRPVILNVKNTRIGIVPIPYIDPRLVKMMPAVGYEEFIKEKIGELKDNPVLKDTDYNILMAHLMLSGAEVTDIFPGYMEEPRVGRKCLYEDFFDYIALGHVHKPQKVSKNIYYPGSIERTSFAEEKEEKAFLYIELSPSETSIEFLPLSCRPMVSQKIIIREASNPLQVLLHSIKMSNIKPGALLKLIIEANIDSWKKIEEKWTTIEDELINNIRILGYSVVKNIYDIPIISRKLVEPQKIPLRKRVLEYIDSLLVDDKIKERAKELAERLMDEVGMP